MSVLTVGSLFAGLGGIDLACERAGMRVVWQCEADATARRVLAHHWPVLPCYSDVREVHGSTVEPVDVIAAGWPCQDVSVAGQRAGLAGTRTGLFWEMVRIVREMREMTGGRYPAFVMGENVPGLLSSHRGRDMARVFAGLAECGALDIGYRILDAQYFGVPQRRRRVFVVADFRAARAAQILALTEGGSGHSAPRRKAGEAVAATPAAGVAASRGVNAPGRRAEDDVNLVLGSFQQNSMEGRGTPLVAFDWQSGGDVQPNISTEHTSALQASQVPAVAWDTAQVTSWANRQNPVNNGASPTLHAGEAPLLTGMQVRRLTPRECSRLQGLPEVQKHLILRVWNCAPEQLKNRVPAAIQNLRWPSDAMPVISTNALTRLMGGAAFAARLSEPKLPSDSKLAALSVHIDSARNVRVLHNHAAINSFVNTAARYALDHRVELSGDFAPRVVGTLLTLDQIMATGGAALLTRPERFTVQQHGGVLVHLSGAEIKLGADDAILILMQNDGAASYTTSAVGLSSQSCVLSLLTSCCSVVRAIAGYIPELTQRTPFFDISVSAHISWLELEPPLSDAAKYRLVGNAVAVPCVQWIAARLVTAGQETT